MVDDFSKYKNKQKILRIIGVIFALIIIFFQFDKSGLANSFSKMSSKEIFEGVGLILLVFCVSIYLFGLVFRKIKEVDRFHFEGDFLIITGNSLFPTSDKREGKVNQALLKC